MTILNLYQAALILSVAGAVLAAYWVKRRMDTETRLANIAGTDKPRTSSTSAAPVSDKLRALNKLFDENMISVEEYVELRKRATP